MSTRCHIIVEDQEWGYNTILYRHSDGYPDGTHGVVYALAEFMQMFMHRRGWDPCFMPAQLLHFLISKDAAHMVEYMKEDIKRFGGPSQYQQEVLDTDGNNLLGYGISSEIHGDIEYAYVITKDGVNVYSTPCMGGCEDRDTWKRLTTDRQAKRIMEGKVPRKWKPKKEKVA